MAWFVLSPGDHSQLCGFGGNFSLEISCRDIFGDWTGRKEALTTMSKRKFGLERYRDGFFLSVKQKCAMCVLRHDLGQKADQHSMQMEKWRLQCFTHLKF